VHLGVGCTLIGAGEILFEDFSSMSAGGSIYSASDDFSGDFFTNPTTPSEYRNVSVAAVRVGAHVIIGAHCVILPGVTIGAGSAVGALSLVTHDVSPGVIMAGSPARQIGKRSRKLFELEQRFRERSA
jgi:dTDP-4-amino-4,6-dideoxy-D-glucose acyltransferase